MYSYSAATGGFHVAGLGAPPPDAVPITEAEHAALLAGQAEGRRIVADQDGAAILVDRPAPPPPPIRAIAPFAFRQRLPTATRRAITLAASRALEAGDATLQTWLDDLSSARNVQLDHPDVAAGVAMLHAAGLITEAQATALLADGTAEEV